jgi:hypothetical protein
VRPFKPHVFQSLTTDEVQVMCRCGACRQDRQRCVPAGHTRLLRRVAAVGLSRRARHERSGVDGIVARRAPRCSRILVPRNEGAHGRIRARYRQRIRDAICIGRTSPRNRGERRRGRGLLSQGNCDQGVVADRLQRRKRDISRCPGTEAGRAAGVSGTVPSTFPG